MADLAALDAEALRRDRQRYARLLEQAKRQRAALNERVDGLRQAVDGLDRLLALVGDDDASGVAPEPRPRRATAAAPAEAPPEPAASAGPDTGAPVPRLPARAPRAAASKKAAPSPPPPTATPAAPEPVEPPAAPAAEAPKGTDAVRLVLESEPGRTWALADLLEVLGARGWLPTSRRPEEGVRISLKRLADRGGATRTDDGRWRLAGNGRPPAQAVPADGTWPPAQAVPADGTWPPAELSPATAPAALASPVEEHPAGPDPEPRRPVPPASFARPGGGTITEL